MIWRFGVMIQRFKAMIRGLGHDSGVWSHDSEVWSHDSEIWGHDSKVCYDSEFYDALPVCPLINGGRNGRNRTTAEEVSIFQRPVAYLGGIGPWPLCQKKFLFSP